MNQLIEQQRAHFALTHIKTNLAVANLKSRANSLPSMIQRNGLGQTLAYISSKKNKDQSWKVMYEMISDWLSSEGAILAEGDDALSAITEIDMHRYRLAQAETLALLLWVRKFARALITSEEVTP